MALDPVPRMQCKLSMRKHLQECTYSCFRVELCQLLGEKEISYGMVR